jgi:hypothetical protein
VHFHTSSAGVERGFLVGLCSKRFLYFQYNKFATRRGPTESTRFKRPVFSRPDKPRLLICSRFLRQRSSNGLVRVRLTGQRIVIGVADSYHPVVSWTEFIHEVYFGQAVEKGGLGVPTY